MKSKITSYAGIAATLRQVPLICIACCVVFCVSCDDDVEGNNNVTVDSSADTGTATDSTDSDTMEGTETHRQSSDASLDSGESDDTVEDAETGDSGIHADTQAVEQCTSGESFNPVAMKCVDCSWMMCNGAGENGVNPLTSASGQCICNTLPGYFYSMSELKAVPCDVDMDGWVTVVARQFEEGSDEGLKSAANCHLRKVSRVVFHPDDASAAATVVDVPPFTLYEASNRDEDFLLQKDKDAPEYGGQRFWASALNSLTKACVNSIADYNANRVPDMEEWSGHEDLDDDFAQYAPYAYFIELHTGWYQDASDGSKTGEYHIAERKRTSSSSPFEQVPLNIWDDTEHNYWRACQRRIDSMYDAAQPQIGMDFAWAVTGYDAQMFHHSQFKCIQAIGNSLSSNSVEAPHQLKAAALSGFSLSRCALSEAEAPEGLVQYESETYNPSTVSFECKPLETAQSGDVALGVARYHHYAKRNDYTRGCINECAELTPWPGLANCEGEAACATDYENYGRAICGCHGNYQYPGCQVCLPRWDLSTGCETCLGNWDVATECRECLPGWDDASECTSCSPGWDEATGCTSCLGKLDEYANCEQCYDDNVFGHWTGEDCTGCIGNWDVDNSCLTCKNRWLDRGDDCGTCPDDIGLGGHWDPEKDCAVCIHRHRNDIDATALESGNLDFGFWDFAADCKTCLDLWVSEATGCSTCGSSSSLKFYYDEENQSCQRTMNLMGAGAGGYGDLEGACVDPRCTANAKDIGKPISRDSLTCEDKSQILSLKDKSLAMTEVTGAVVLSTGREDSISYHIGETQKLKYIRFEGSFATCGSHSARMTVKQYDNDSTEIAATPVTVGTDNWQASTGNEWTTLKQDIPLDAATALVKVSLESDASRLVMFDDIRVYLSMNRDPISEK
ncbi:MAG: hypothetical protein JXX14_17175 [Deltaproteobacteria bacterium]|nr:hypothetical protein [Deltaproteobacteria bacterium]